MGIFDRRNTFYNSTWHQYKLPSSSWQLTNPLVTQDGNNIKLNWNGYNHPQNSIVWNPFGLEQRSWTGYNPETGEYGTLPMSPRYVEPSQHSYIDPIPPYKPYNAPSHYDYDDIYSDADPNKKPVSDQTIENIRMGLNGATQTIDALGQGRTTGDNDANHYIGMVSKIGSNLPGKAGLIFSSINAASSIVNALVGSKLNDKNIKAMESAIQNRSRYQFGDNSTTDALIAGSQSNVDLAAPGADFYGKDGLLQDWLGYGVGKAHGKAWSNKRLIDNANAQAHNTEALAYKDYQNKMIRRGLLAEPYALGGAINRFDNGGGINKPYTHGSLFTNGLVQINNGGSHEANPYQGVQFGVDPQGVPNMVEEGETIFNAGAYGGPDSYSFSDRIKFPTKEYGNMFALGGKTKRVKGKRNKNYTFADVSKLLSKESEERPNDDKSLRTLAANLEKLAMIQEEVKAKDMLSQMNPLDIMAALQQSPIGEQMVDNVQQNADGQSMMEQQPMMAAYGGHLFNKGGKVNIYADAGKLNYTYSPDSGEKVYGLPESMRLHEGLFGEAISDYIKQEYDKYEQYKKDGDWNAAEQVAAELSESLWAINYLYLQAVRNPNDRNAVINLQSEFDKLGLNKNVEKQLSTKNDKDSYPIYKGDDKVYSDVGKERDGKFGMVSQARYIGGFTEQDKQRLSQMHITPYSYNDFMKAHPDVNTDPDNVFGEGMFPNDITKNLYFTFHNDYDDTEQVILNPAWTEGSDEPKYISMIDYLTMYENMNFDNAEPTDEQIDIMNKYTEDGEPIKIGPFEYQQVYKLADGAVVGPQKTQIQQQEQKSTQGEVSADNTQNNNASDKDKFAYRLKPQKDWESDAALGITLADYLDSMFGNGRTFQSPGANAAYNYVSRLENIPMVRSTPTGTKMVYRPRNLNFDLNSIDNTTLSNLRAINNLNQGFAAANNIAMLNSGRDAAAKARQQALEDDLKTQQVVFANNNQVDQTNAQNSLAAQQTNAQNLAKAREAQATIASQLANTLSQNYNNWLNYRNTQSSGLAQLLYNRGYNKTMFDLKNRAFLLMNQHPEMAMLAGIPMERVKKTNGMYDPYDLLFG